MDIYEEVLHKLSSKVRIRQLFKNMHIEDVERIIQRCSEILNEKKQEQEKILKNKEQKRKKIAEIHKLMNEKGLTLADLEQKNITTKKYNKTEKFVFEFITLSGKKICWQGARTGRLPEDFREFLSRTGKQRMDCIVPKKEYAT